MNSFLGIGPLELIFILIFALIFLGPERLPGAVRQIANIVKQIRNLSGTLSQQLGEEFGDMRDLDPRYQFQQMLDEPDEKEKEAAKKAEEEKKAEEAKKRVAEAKRKGEERRKAASEKAAKEAEEKKKAAEAKKMAEQKTNAAEGQDAKRQDAETDSETGIGSDTSPDASTDTSTDEDAPAPVAAPPASKDNPPVAESGATDTPAAVQPKQRSADEQTSPASAPFVQQRAEARAAANSLIPKTSENTIAPPTQPTETPEDSSTANQTAGNQTAGNQTAGKKNGDEIATSAESVESPVVEEEQA